MNPSAMPPHAPQQAGGKPALPLKLKNDLTIHDASAVFKQIRASYNVRRDEIKLVKRVAAGATGIVYLAKWQDIDVAAKVCHTDEASLRDLIAELDILLQMGKHPNVVAFYGACIENKKEPIILEEYVHGPNIDQYFQKDLPPCGRPRLPKVTAYSWITDMLKALEFLHNRDPIIMHRDLKAGNLILSGDLKHCKLADFGMSKQVRKMDMNTSIHTGFTGTVRYMAPEVLTQAEGHYTEKCDIYSAGLIMYYISCGQRPPMLDRHTTEGLQKRPDTNNCDWPDLAAVMVQMWVPNPEQRISASDALKQLRAMPTAPDLNMEEITIPKGCACTIS